MLDKLKKQIRNMKWPDYLTLAAFVSPLPSFGMGIAILTGALAITPMSLGFMVGLALTGAVLALIRIIVSCRGFPNTATTPASTQKPAHINSHDIGTRVGTYAIAYNPNQDCDAARTLVDSISSDTSYNAEAEEDMSSFISPRTNDAIAPPIQRQAASNQASTTSRKRFLFWSDNPATASPAAQARPQTDAALKKTR